jgi:hypothetical protein
MITSNYITGFYSYEDKKYDGETRFKLSSYNNYDVLKVRVVLQINDLWKNPEIRYISYDKSLSQHLIPSFYFISYNDKDKTINKKHYLDFMFDQETFIYSAYKYDKHYNPILKFLFKIIEIVEVIDIDR